MEIQKNVNDDHPLLKDQIGLTTEDTLKNEAWLLVRELRKAIQRMRALDEVTRAIANYAVGTRGDKSELQAMIDAIHYMTAGACNTHNRLVDYLRYDVILNDIEYQIAADKIPTRQVEHRITTSGIQDEDMTAFKSCLKNIAEEANRLQKILDRNYPNEVSNRPIVKMELTTTNSKGESVVPVDFNLDSSLRCAFKEVIERNPRG